jgi:hypothetical protein
MEEFVETGFSCGRSRGRSEKCRIDSIGRHSSEPFSVGPCGHQRHVFVDIKVQMLKQDIGCVVGRRAETADAESLAFEIFEFIDPLTSKNDLVVHGFYGGHQD